MAPFDQTHGLRLRCITSPLIAAMFLLVCPSASQAVIASGGLAVIGYDDNLDTFTAIALDPIMTGEVVYFTNNGWSSSLGRFSGSDPSQGAGNESIIKLTITAPVAKGTVLTASSDGSSWAWTKTGLIPGQVDGFGEFSDLSLDFENDQIYAFQASTANPLGSPTNFIYALHFGSPDVPGFSDAEDTFTGDVPPGLTEAGHTAFAHTDFSFHGDADGNHSAWGLNMSAPEVMALQASGGHKLDWLAAIGKSSNWGAAVPTVTQLLVMPEPSRACLILAGAIALSLRRIRINLNRSLKF